MRIRINFDANVEPFTKPVNDYVNGFVNKCLGENNKWHDSFSAYNVSMMQGGQLVDGNIQYPNGGYIIISVADTETEFINALLIGLTTMTDGKVQTMKYRDFRTYSVPSGPKYDVARIECVRLMENDKAITCKDSDFLDKLRNHTVAKLKRCGLEDKVAESIKFEPLHEEGWRVKYVKVKNYNEHPVVTPSSNIMIVMKGLKEAREKVISLGVGQSTGCGFGFMKFKKDNQ